MKRFFSAILVLLLCFSVFSVTALATDFNLEMTSYYYKTNDDSKISISDPYKLLETDYTVDTTKLIEMFSTNTNSKDSMLSLCNKILEGEKLSNLIKSKGQFYTVLENSSGKENAYAIVEKDGFSVSEFGEFGGFRRDLQLNSKVQNQLSQKMSSASKIKMTYCVIDCFATGTLVSDGNNEYFIKTVEGIESSGIIEEGKLYSVTELASIIKNNIDKIYGTNEVDEEGNPHTGAGIVIEQKNDNIIIYKYIGITSALLSIVCFVIATRIKFKKTYRKF